MDKIKKEIYQSGRFNDLAESVRKLEPGNRIYINGLSGSLLSFLASFTFDRIQRQIVLIAPDEARSEKLRDDCATLLGEAQVRFLGAPTPQEVRMLDVTSSVSRLEALISISSGGKFLVIASPGSIAEKIPSPEKFLENILELHVGKASNFQKFNDHLIKFGFEQKNFVETYGDFAVRGGIVDVFSYAGDNPVRFEFWGDTVESIREFDIISQRSIKELKSASIIPNLADGEAGLNQNSLFSYLSGDAVVILDEPEIIKREIDELTGEGQGNLYSYEEIAGFASGFGSVVHSIFGIAPSSGEGKDRHLIFDYSSLPQPSFNGSVNHLVNSIAGLEEEGYKVYLASDTMEETSRLRELIEEVANPSAVDQKTKMDGGEHGRVAVAPRYLTGSVHSGFIYPPSKVALFTEHEIFGRLKRRGSVKRKRFKGFSQKEIKQLKHGDYVVHVDHGIGEFAGLQKIKVGGAEQEVMKLLFLEKDVLYVNLNYINRIQKYSSQEGHAPKLSKLGAPDWEKMKSRAKSRIKDIARELISLYAQRKKEKGFAFSPDSHWQKELEASFIYEDTADQAATTLEVKRDMESPSPMDRLICGDVGFGKTEIAVRAAFKAVMDGKQVAVLVPTTILALQHYNTFTDRLNRYSAKIENLTRFKSKKEQVKTVDEMKKGSVDIVIGTHRLLSKDIQFKDLGLLIIDEEHRFGVSAKEKLRQLKASVDTLALTATPIPRTLHFSLIGARDLSLINSAPRNRIPIITEIIPGSESRRSQWQIIREAILKEIHRGGQVYFVHDRVQNIEAIAQQIKSHVPEVRVHVAHGQLAGHELEKTMLDFLERKFDILVATKIIESGLDIPNVNTIVINRADRFGLAELYQLRGRVGRSNIQAYAYLLVPPIDLLPKDTLRRLSAIEEFTDLGSGFNLAMRDLEIRGAGNLLGAEQSGFIMEMGFEMYEKIVRESVEELKMEEFKELIAGEKPSGEQAGTEAIPRVTQRQVESVIDTDIEALIPDFYVESDVERLDIYRRLYRAASEEEINTVREELNDRFGEYPVEVENLLRLVGIRLMASKSGFPKISIRGERLTITLPPQTDTEFYGEVGETISPFQEMMKTVSAGKRKDVQLKQAGKDLTLEIRLENKTSGVVDIDEIRSKIETYSPFTRK